jgi:hypothetical protein
MVLFIWAIKLREMSAGIGDWEFGIGGRKFWIDFDNSFLLLKL